MPGYRVGIDGGSTFCKLALLSPGGELIDKRAAKSGWQPAHSAQRLLEQALLKSGVERGQVSITCTGYSRELIDFADGTLTEITAHARGAAFLMPEVCGVIDIGGQDSKAIRIQNGRVQDFIMNDKCAAGTGRFVEMALRTLELDPADADGVCDTVNPACINSMCTVFAESEIIGLIAAGTDRGRILGGVMSSIASRVSQMLTRTQMPKSGLFLMTGGLSSFSGLVKAICAASGREITVHDDSIYAGAIGAALSGK